MTLLPLAMLYGALMWLRNRAFDWGWKKSHRVNTVILSVGNLSMGGTGKTPMIETLVKILESNFSLGMVSRGYQRATQGIHLAEGEETAMTLGDEPFQLYRKFEHLAIAVGAERTSTVKHLLRQKGSRDIVLLDDAFQHRSIQRDVNIMLTTYEQPFFHDYVLPAGNLRENRSGAKRADAIVVTKCPGILARKEREQWLKHIEPYAPHAEVFFSHLVYDDLKAVVGETPKQHLAVLAGIAQPQVFIKALEVKYTCQHIEQFPDHHTYTSADLDRIMKTLQGQDCSLVTTEKDMVRLLPFKDHPLIQTYGLFYLPMSTAIQNNETFVSWLEGRLENHMRKNHQH